MANMNRYTEALFDLLRTEREICTHSKNQPPKVLLQQAERQREHLADLARAIDEGEAMSQLPRTDEERAYFFGKKVAEAQNFGDRKRADHWMGKFGELREGYGPPGDARRIRINAPYYAAYSKYRRP